MMETEFISEDLIACRACLATNTDFYSIAGGLENIFVQLMDVEFSEDDGLPQHLCSCCRMLLLKFHHFRRRCDRSQTLLRQAQRRQPYISTNDIQSIDRKHHKLSLNLVQLSVYTFDSTIQKEKYTLQEKLKSIIQDTTNNTIDETDAFDDRDDFDDTNKPDDALDEPTESVIQNSNNVVDPGDKTEDPDENKTLFVEIDGLNGIIKVNTLDHSADAKKRRIAAIRKQHKKEQAKKKAEKKIEQQERISKLIKYIAGKKKEEKPLTKRQLIQRRPENDFLPNFDHAEFERENDVKIHILTLEEQIQELAERKQSMNYMNLEYKCERCSKGFEFDTSYNNHMLKHDPKAGKFACDLCGVRYRIRSLLLRHLDMHRIKFVCNICTFVTRAKHAARNHFQMHMGRVYQCKHCDATFTKKTSYFGHVRITHPSTEFSCEICGDSFVGRRGLLFHKAKAHLELRNKKLKCRKCDVQFASFEAKDKHMNGQKSCDVNLKACGECGETLADEDQLNSHRDEKHARDMHWCDECSLSFVSQASLDTHHQRIHLRKKWPAYGRIREMNKEYYKQVIQKRRMIAQVVCDMCGIKVRSSSALVKHQESMCKKEKSTKRFNCPYCERSCSTRQGLRVHINTHTGEKPFKCKQCPLAFRQAAALKRHHNRVHLGLDSRARCQICDKTFSTTTSLKLHINTVHFQLPHPARRRKPRDDDS